MANVLVINGHPASGRLSGALADAYALAAERAGASVRRLALADMEFDPIARGASTRSAGSGESALEPDLQKAQADLRWADHVALVFPVWWATAPALLKGFFERTLLPGFAFRYPDKPGFPIGLLKGRSARVIVTMDSPGLWDRLMQGRAMHHAVSRATLGFCGFSPVKETILYRAGARKRSEVDAFLSKVQRQALHDVRQIKPRTRSQDTQAQAKAAGT